MNTIYIILIRTGIIVDPRFMPDKTSKMIASIKQKVSKLKDEELKQGVLNVDYFWTTRAIISPGIFSFSRYV